MSLNFAAISPHPPIIVPQIAGQDLAKVSSTVLAMKKLATIFQKAEIDTLIIVSPHLLIYPDRFNVCAMKKLFGTFAPFDHPEIITESNNDLDLVADLEKEMINSGINHVIYDNGGEFFELDHGTMVPLNYLSKNQEFTFKVVPIAYSNLDRAQHFAFGQILKDVCQKYSGRVGIIASGDLSHSLLDGINGKKFDEKLIEDLKNNNLKEILYYDEDFVQEARECGYRSILILLGAVDGLGLRPEFLSYEGPFGVGYLVLNYDIKENQ